MMELEDVIVLVGMAEQYVPSELALDFHQF